ncbi:MAG: proton-conducting transporter membrane subunit [Verrucomicrobiae bacterium]|nr:proton-conducting transporter membrane subunit [Verrucomicrobiae bacterium]
MKEIALIALPLIFAAAAFAWPDERSRPRLLPIVGTLHAVLAFWLLIDPPALAAHAWFGFDPLARAVLPMVSLLFLVCSMYGVTYLQIRAERKNRIFVTALLVMLGLLSLALQAQNLGVLWVAAEATTLVTVPLLHFNGTGRAFEASWKYLLVGGTGIALSLLGSFCLGYASLMGGGDGDLTFSSLNALFIQMTPVKAVLAHPWLVTAWVLLIAGYGTKMGLAPMHTWKPDAYGEAPGIVGALLAGGTTTMAFVAILRVKQVVDAAGGGAMTERTLLAFGLFSMFAAALFLLGTPDYKRMLAYSSVEHMGILTVGAALGGAGLWAALFHVWTNALTKGSMFLSAGNIRRAAGAQTEDKVSGMAWRTPGSARLFIVGLFAVTACPPFGVFFSELQILLAAFKTGNVLAATVFLGCLLFAFFGMTRLVFAIVDGRPRAAARKTHERFPELPGIIVPPLLFLALSLWLGLATPPLLHHVWVAAAKILSPTP